MDLRLRIEVPGHRPRDVYVEFDGERRVGELAVALAQRLEAPGSRERVGLYSRRRAGWLPADSLVTDVGVREGDELVLAPAGSAIASGGERDAVAKLLVTGGPCAGLSFALAPGEHQVGRSPECDVVIDDPAVSRIHLLVTVGNRGGAVVRNARSANGIFVNGRRVTGQVPLPPGQELELGRTLIRFEPVTEGAVAAPDGTGRIAFNRPPRSALEPPEHEFKVKPPEKGGRSAAFSISSSLLPLVMGLVMFAYTQSPMTLAFAFLSPLMVIGTFLEEMVGSKSEDRQTQKQFREHVAGLSQDMAGAYRNVAHFRRLLSPDLASLIDWAATANPRLWERREGNPDFLLLRVGWGDQPSGVTLEVEPGGSARLRSQVMRLAKHYARLPSLPIALSLGTLGSMGLAGPRQAVLGMTRSLALQVALTHSPKDVMLVVATAPGDRDQWRWLGWLPHVHPEAPPIQGAAVADSRPAARDLLDRLIALLDQRLSSQSATTSAASVKMPAVVAILDSEADLPRGGVDRLLRHGRDCGIYVIWLGREQTELPGDVAAVVELDRSTFAPRITVQGAQARTQGISSDLAPLGVAERAALALAPIRDVEATAGAAEIPRYVSLLDLLQLQRDPVERMIQRWWRSDGRLGGLIGVGADNQPFGVSLRYDGPHGLAGGMTGAGKSEMLQTLVAGLAAAHSPERLTFILVDYKGGAAFKDCVQLPHTVGLVTDLDGHLVNRALTSLRAELRYREEVLSEHGYKDLIDFESADIQHAFPSLFIVVDEFGALAGELPEFVDGMVDIAQRGRSLGIHLLLATQRPAGVISDRIRVNTPLRLSLRFADASDSQDVIGTKDAARPGLPRGRAFARTATGGYFEFQAAHASGQTPVDGGPRPVQVYDLDVNGEAVEEAGGGGPSHSGGLSDLQRVVQGAQEAARRLRLPEPRKPWLPQLPEALPLESLDSQLPQAWLGRPVVPLGLVDNPARQSQYLAGFDIEKDGNLAVYGRSGSGKTVLLRSLAVGIARSLPPGAVHIYGMDFATRGLRPLLSLPHCGDVVGGDEPDRGQRLLHMLTAELNRRRALFGEHGATTLAEYHRAGGSRLPSILVLLDGYTGFVTAYENVDLGAPIDQFRALLLDGQALGISFVLTANRAAAIASGMSAAISRKVVFRMANDDEYMFVGLDRSVYLGANLPPGRGFLDQGLELQAPVVGSVSAQAEAIEAIGAELRERFPDAQVPKVRMLPTDLSSSSLPVSRSPLTPVIGLKDPDLSPAVADLSEGHMLVAGPRRSGKSTTLATFAASLARAPGARALFLLSPSRRSPLPQLNLWTASAVGTEACVELTQKLLACLDGTSTDFDLSRGTVVLLDDGEEMMDMSVASEVEALAKQGRDHDVRMVGAIESSAAQRVFGGWLAEVQRDRQGILLNPDPMTDGGLVGGVRLPSRRGNLPPGRAYLVEGGIVTTIQVAG